MKTKIRTLLTTALLGLTLAACAAPDTAAAAEKAKPYPLAKCLISGNDLDSMGGPITKVYNPASKSSRPIKPNTFPNCRSNPAKMTRRMKAS